MPSLIPSLWGKDRRDPVASLRDEIDNLFDAFGRGLPARFPSLSEKSFPALDVAETADAVEVTAELPGVDEKDVELSVTDDVLSIKGEKKSEHVETDKDMRIVERSYGSFARSVSLPFRPAPNSVQATFKAGVLKVHVPKPPEAKSNVQKIDIKPA